VRWYCRYTTLLNRVKETALRSGTIVDGEEQLFRIFTRNVQRNLHVVFTMNPASGDFDNRAATSPALFNRCVVDWFGDWSRSALHQVGRYFMRTLDVEYADYTLPAEAATLFQDALDEEEEESKGASSSGARGSGVPPIVTYRDAVSSALVRTHELVRRATLRVGRRTGRTFFISPRDYVDFINHFVHLFRSKRQALEDEQRHLNTGLTKIHQTEEQVAALQASLGNQKTLLTAKTKEADAKVAQMVQDQNDAERKKQECEALAKELAAQNETIATRRAVVEGELAKVEPMLADARDSVKGIRKSHLDAVRAMGRPPQAVRMTLEAVVTMLGHKTTEWKDIRRTLSKSDFIPTILNFKTSQITPKIAHQIRAQLKNPDFKCVHTRHGCLCASFAYACVRVVFGCPFGWLWWYSYEAVNRASKTTGPLFKWLVSQTSYAQILTKVEPLRSEVRMLQEESSRLEAQFEEQTQLTANLEASIATYKQEYAVLIREAEAIKTEMESVQSRVARSTKLLASLSGERRRWEAGSGFFHERMHTIAGDTMLAAAFLTYAGRFDFKMRRVVLNELRIALETVGAPYRGDLALTEYLSTASDRLAWSAASLPSDELCVENAIMLSRFNRFPLVIDPAGQAIEFLKRHYGREREVSVTSFLDASFMKHLESALRFGMTLVVQDVDTIDPVMNPVLNREFHKAGGRVLVQVRDVVVWL